MLYIGSSELIQLMIESWYSLTNLSSFSPLLSPWQPPFYSVSLCSIFWERFLSSMFVIQSQISRYDQVCLSLSGSAECPPGFLCLSRNFQIHLSRQIYWQSCLLYSPNILLICIEAVVIASFSFLIFGNLCFLSFFPQSVQLVFINAICLLKEMLLILLLFFSIVYFWLYWFLFQFPLYCLL